MDKRSWPWKKKSTDKSNVDTGITSTSTSNGNVADEEDSKVVKYVQITPDQYSNFTNAEEQVKLLNERISILEENLSAAQSEVSVKEGLVKQHAKVAEEAISGWEKAEAEATALKLQLETVTLSRLASDERAAHLDGALKECMKQIRAVKEESEQRLQDVVFAKTQQWEMLRSEFEAKISECEQELLRAAAENDVLSRSLQEHSDMLMKLGDEKAQAEAEIELLKSNIQSCDREINSLKYELHVVSKELTIRNEEKNMSVRSADVANKQHLEDVKKISKLEAECQRLRGLVRKKLPGPAALAQMKIEVESLGREFGDNRLRRSPAKNSAYHPSAQASELAFENLQHVQKENEYLASRMLSMEEEAKMLKEALAKRNSELQTVRSLYSKTASKLHSLEVHSTGLGERKTPNSKTSIPCDGTISHSGSNPPSLTSMSEDGVDDEGSCPETWAGAPAPEFSQLKEKSGGASNTSHLELMDDFLEMERLASDANDSVGLSDRMKIDSPESTVSGITEKHEDYKETQELNGQYEPLSALQSRIFSLFDPQSQQKGVTEIMASIRHVLNVFVESPCSDASSKDYVSAEGDLRNAVSQIHDFIKSIGKETTEFQVKPSDYRLLSDKIERFSAVVDKLMLEEKSLDDLVVALAHVLSAVSVSLSTDRLKVVEINNVDFVDKVTLLENKVIHQPMQENLGGSYASAPRSSDFESDNAISNGFSVKGEQFSFEEYEQLKSDKANLEMQLATCNDLVESTTKKLQEMQKNVDRVQEELAASEKSNSLAETQLKCMAQSYRSLEASKLQLEEDIKELQMKITVLTAELCEERQSHEEDLTRYIELQEQMERFKKENIDAGCDEETKTRQEMEIAAAAEKLAECQETILLLGRQLQAMRPADMASPSPNRQRIDPHSDDETSPYGGRHSKKPSSQMDLDVAFAASIGSNPGGESPYLIPSDSESSPYPKSPSSTKHPKNRSRSSSSTSFPNPEKQGRVFSRFFSKGKADNSA